MKRIFTILMTVCLLLGIIALPSHAIGENADDTYAGTLTYTPAEDGKTVTISYEADGETVSYTVPNQKNYLSGGYAGVDDLGRSLYTSEDVGSYRADERYVGLFYFLWHGEHGDSGIFDLQKIIDELGVEEASKLSCGKYGPVGEMHFFAEPLYGYYYANDAWVLRKHAELLTNANIDFLYFDVTNTYPYIHNALTLMECLSQLNAEGYDAPQVVFYTNSAAHSVVRQCYDAIYSKGLYQDTWFCIDGKPVIIAPEDANIDGFFHMKQNQWPDAASQTNGWPWMDFNWPARVFPSSGDDGSAISVSIAQHCGTVCFSHSSLYDNRTNRGRSFNNPDGIASDDRKNYAKVLMSSYKAWQADPNLTDYGFNFQAQFDHAIASDATYILVTGWNEWVAQRQDADFVFFVDTASMEFSRDAEMMRGGYFDNYYMQLIYNVQKLKGTAPVVVQDARKPIDITGDFAQWSDVIVEYADPSGDTMKRDAIGFGQKHLTNDTGRNDLVASKVIGDSENLYFYAQTAAAITAPDTASSWMQLYVNVDADAATGWYGYDYIINHKTQDAATTTVAKYTGTDNAFGFETVGEVAYRVEGNEMMIAVPLELLGIEQYDRIKLEFKWADSTTLYDELEDFYCDGDVAPLGRLNYIYQNCLNTQSSSPDTETSTETITETETESVTETETETETESVTETVTETESESATETESAIETAAATETVTETETETETAASSQTETESATATGEGTTTVASEDEGGCASAVLSTGILLSLLGGARLLRRKE